MSERDDALAELAALAGIAPSYIDAFGNEQRTAPDVRRALLAAMGLPVGDARSIQDAIQNLAEAEWRDVLPTAQTLEAGTHAWTAAAMPATGGMARWRVVLEDGTVQEAEAPTSDLEVTGSATVAGATLLRLRLPLPPLAEGYHRLEVERPDGPPAISRLIIAPRLCHLPERLDQGGRAWGLAAQLYGLRSRRNWGIGEYGDLNELVRGCARVGADAIGLSPLHAGFAAAPERISPYSPSSRMCLNTLYLDIEAMDGWHACPEARALVAGREAQARLSALREADLVDYRAIADLKRPVTRALFDWFMDHGDHAAFAAFREERGEPLRVHAVFEALDSHFHAQGMDWWGQWPEAYRGAHAPAVERFAAEHEREITYHAWLQFQADRQLARASETAASLDMCVGLYGDLAVGADRAGSEVWFDPGRYVSGASVGAPPDEWIRLGQNWGLPPLNPVHLRAEGFLPFIQLLRGAMRHMGALRIDHAFSLARLYWIPEGCAPQDGAYVRYPLETLLAIIRLESRRNRCMVIGEDLGTAPAGFSDALMASGILSYRLLYFEKRPDGGFKAPADHPRMALIAASTHDLPTLAGWWNEKDVDIAESNDLYPEPGTGPAMRARRAADRGALNRDLSAIGLAKGQRRGARRTDPAPVLAAHRMLARSPSLLMMAQLEDALELEEQANVPGTIDEHPNWRRRLPVELGALLGTQGPVARLAEAIAAERPGPGRRAAAGQPPAATYRLQFNAGFTFDDAARVIPYLARLGISHVYASPFLMARPGSTHGYDITDHGRLNQELGGNAGFARFRTALERHGIGLIVDFVPNHMGVGGADNPWWLSLLEWGRLSPTADYFDVDWSGGGGRVVTPFLENHYGEVLDAGGLVLRFDEAEGSFAAWHYDHRFPICPVQYPMVLEMALASMTEVGSDEPAMVEARAVAERFRGLTDEIGGAREKELPGWAEPLKLELAGLARRYPSLREGIDRALALFNGAPGRPESMGSLHRLLELQSYHLASWRVAASDINYRRFFDINDLAGLRIEDADLFARTHEHVLGMIAAGQAEGIRIDHVDGLADPTGYLRRLREAVGPDVPILVEKILGHREKLPRSWPVEGTTGYDVLSSLNGLFVDPAAERFLDRLFQRFTGIDERYEDLLASAKSEVLEFMLASELQVLTGWLKTIANADRRTRDYTAQALRRALSEIIAWFPIYRTYVDADGARPDDRRIIGFAVERARHLSRMPDRTVYDFVERVLVTPPDEALPGGPSPDLLRRFVARFQQLTGPVMAKGLEDTLFYRYPRLLSLNEVGSHPDWFGTSVEEFHAGNRERLGSWPLSIVATSTHDTKRGEDVRARLNVLTELPAAWGARVTTWARLNREHDPRAERREAPTGPEEYLIYQTLVGSWPVDLLSRVPAKAALGPYLERLEGYLIKALREAKVNTSWVNVREHHEQKAIAFLRRILTGPKRAAFLADFLPFTRRIAHLGMINALSQTTLKLTIPGVPDIYQGSEFWDMSLVDPDNRRPVDYDQRQRALGAGQSNGKLLRAWQDGAIKQRIVATLLAHRRADPALYREGDYLPIAPAGARAENAVAFLRRRGNAALLVVVPRLIARPLDGAGADLPLGEAFWGDTRLPVPVQGTYFDLFGGRTVEIGETARLGDLLGELPVGVFATA